MAKFFSLTIRAQLFLMALIVALPAAGIIVHSGMKQRVEAIAEAEAETDKLAAHLVSEQQTLVACAKQLLSTLAQLPEVKLRDKKRVSTLLSDNLKLNPQFYNVFISDQNGVIWASGIPFRPPVTILDRKYFLTARLTGRFSSGECVVDRIHGMPALTFGYPLINSRGEFQGVIGVNFNLTSCAKTVERFKLPPRSSCLITDHRGVVVGRGFNPNRFIGAAMGEKEFAAMRGARDGATGISHGVDGISRFSTYRKLYLEGESQPYMYLRAGIPEDAVSGAANMALLRNLCLLTPFLIFAFFMAGRIGKRSIVDRVAQLQSASQRLAAGDLQVRVSELVTGGELGNLALSFDAMASALHREREALRESENNFRALAETANDGMLVSTANGSIVYANSRIGQIVGSPPAHLQVGRLHDLIHPEERAPVLERLEGDQERAHQFETRLVTSAGKEVPVEVTWSRTLWQGEPAQLVIVRDIFQRKRAEKELRESYGILQRTFESLNESVFIVRKEGERMIIETCNSMTSSMFGYSAEELMGASMDLLHLSPERHQDFQQQMMRAFREKGFFETTSQLKRRDGSVFDSEHVVTPIHSHREGVVSYVSVVRNISERKRQEEMLQAKALVLENMAEGVSECDKEGRILFTNPAFDAIFGYDKGELIGQNVALLGHRALLSSDPLSREVVKHVNNHGVWFGEFSNIKKDGTIFPTYARINVVPCSGNWITVLEDITERQEMDRMKDEMISAVSHEMRTPLTALLGYFQVMRDITLDEGQLREVLDIMHAETVRLNELIGNFLDLQRLKARKVLYCFRPLELRTVLQEAAAAFSGASSMHDIEVHFASDLPQVIGDEARLHQVFHNLLSNAIKYSPDGGKIVLAAEPSGDSVCVSVRDNGIGIPHDALNKIFDKFYRVDNTDSRLVGGTGLGLAVVREVVDTHGAELRVESVLGEGSTFYFTLPVADKKPNLPVSA